MDVIVTKRISALVENNEFKSFMIMDPDTFKVLKMTKGLYIDGPCDIVYRLDNGNPLQIERTIGKKRVWTLTDSNIKCYPTEQYHDDRLKTIIYIDPRNIFKNISSKDNKEECVCRVFQDGRSIECMEVLIKGPSRWVSNPFRKFEFGNFSCSVWAETDSEIEVIY
jgi:hypothetical protein